VAALSLVATFAQVSHAAVPLTDALGVLRRCDDKRHTSG